MIPMVWCCVYQNKFWMRVGVVQLGRFASLAVEGGFALRKIEGLRAGFARCLGGGGALLGEGLCRSVGRLILC